jgi:hypothetical protein
MQEVSGSDSTKILCTNRDGKYSTFWIRPQQILQLTRSSPFMWDIEIMLL